MRGGRVVGALNSSHMAHLRAKFPPWCTFRPMDSSVGVPPEADPGFLLTESDAKVIGVDSSNLIQRKICPTCKELFHLLLDVIL